MALIGEKRAFYTRKVVKVKIKSANFAYKLPKLFVGHVILSPPNKL